MPHFPDTIVVGGGKKLILIKEEKKTLTGENPKKCYEDSDGNTYIVKMEKERKIEDIFKNSLSVIPKAEEPATKNLQKHIEALRDTATATSVIAGHIAKAIFPSLVVPQNYLARLKDGTPIVLSKFLPKPLDEFLSTTSVITMFKPTKPTDWTTLFTRSALNLKMDQVKILGKIYYIALLMGHWDIINNIDLKNSGSITIKKECKPCIVDWGNCLGIGFGGLCQDATAFQNPEFKDLKLKSGHDPVTGFMGSVPFNHIVYSRLPRQLAPDLFDLTTDDMMGKTMLEGFKEAREEARKNLIQLSIKKAMINTLGEEDTCHFKDAFNQELFGTAESYSGDKEPELKKILIGRFHSIETMIKKIDAGEKMHTIMEEQFEEMIKSQQIIKPKARL